MLSDSYKSHIYCVKGESIEAKPNTFFESTEVYLIIDTTLKIIWIWAGSKSRLFYRYTASSWAGKLKSKKKYYNFNYELIKQGREPDDFITIFNEINEGREDLSYPGESRIFITEISKSASDQNIQLGSNLTNSEKVKIKKILAEISEMQLHIKYSLEHIGKRIQEINKIIEK